MACKYPQKRNWKTGRCKKPCARHEAVNPATGKCVSKSYLRSLHWYYDSDEDEFEEYDDLADGLVPDSSCKAPTKLNIFTGKCRTPCGPHRMINPSTGQCVTKAYLRSLDYELYDSDEDDYLLSERLFYPRMSRIGLIARLFGKNYLAELVRLTALTNNDMTVMESIKKGIVDTLDKPALVGVYDGLLRKKCETFTLSKLINTKLGECGVSSVYNYSTPPAGKTPEGIMKDALVEAHKKSSAYSFICVPGTALPDMVYIERMKKASSAGYNAKMLVICDQGVWNIIIPKYSAPKLESFPTGLPDKDAAKKISEDSEGEIVVTFHDFDKKIA